MNARTSLPLLVAMTLAAAPAAAQPASAVPGLGGLGGLGGGQDSFSLVNQTAMLGGDYSAQDDMQMKQWFADTIKRGEIVFWDEDSKIVKDGVTYYTRFGQVVGDNQVSFTDGIRRQSTMPVPMDSRYQAKADEMRMAMGECAPGFVGPPSPGLDCDKVLGDLAKAMERGGAPPKPKDPDQQQLASAENNMWGGNDKGSSGDKKSGGMGIMSTGGGDEGSDSADTPSPNPSRPPANDTIAASGGGDTGFDDGSDIGGDSGQVTGDTGRVGASGDGGGMAGRSSGQGGGDKGRGVISVSGNEAVAEHDRKYGKGYTFSAVDRAAQGGTRIIDETAESFGMDNAAKEAAQKAPPVHYGTMKITPGDAPAEPGAQR